MPEIYERALSALFSMYNQSIPPSFFSVVKWFSTNSARDFSPKDKQELFDICDKDRCSKNFNKASVLSVFTAASSLNGD